MPSSTHSKKSPLRKLRYFFTGRASKPVFGIASRIPYLRLTGLAQLSHSLASGKLCMLFIHLGDSARSKQVAGSLEEVQKQLNRAVQIFGVDAEADPRLVEQLLPRTADLPSLVVRYLSSIAAYETHSPSVTGVTQHRLSAFHWCLNVSRPDAEQAGFTTCRAPTYRGIHH